MKFIFKHIQASQTLPLMALIASAAAMAISVVFVRQADVGPFASAFYRVGLALPFMALACMFAGQRLWPKGPWVSQKAIVFAGLFFAGDLFFWHLSILNTTVANATFFATMAPVVVLILSGWILNETVSKRAWIALFMCLVGGGFLAGSSYSINAENLVGDAYGLVTALFFGLFTLQIRKARRTESALTVTISSTFITALILLIVTLVTKDNAIPHSTTGIWALVGLAIVSQIGGQGLFAFALGRLPAAFSSLVIFFEGLTAALFGYLFLNESLTALQTFGAFIVLWGIVVAQRPVQKSNPKGK